MSTQEFNTYFDELETKLYPVAYNLTNNVEDAKDLIQETALRAYSNKHNFTVGTNFRAWVITIMRNTFINFYRKRKFRKTYAQPNDSFVFINDNHANDNQALSNIMMQELNNIIHNLDVAFRKPFMMFYEGYKYEEIALAMQLPVGTVKSRIFFARKKLKTSINNYYA